MKKSLTFRHMEHSNAMEEYVNEHLTKIEDFLKNEPSPVYLIVVLMADKRRSVNEGELLIKTPHYDLIAKTEGADMYDVIDSIIDTMYQDLHKKKKRLLDERKSDDKYKSV